MVVPGLVAFFGLVSYPISLYTDAKEITYPVIEELDKFAFPERVEILMHPNFLLLLNDTIPRVSNHVAKLVQNKMLDLLVGNDYTLGHIISRVNFYDEIKYLN